MKADSPCLRVLFFLSAFIGALVFFSCGRGNKAPSTLPAEGLVPAAEAGAALDADSIDEDSLDKDFTEPDAGGSVTGASGGEPRVRAAAPEFPAGDLKGRLPAFGVDIRELNPGGYKKTGAEILEKMELPPYYAAFLSGEQLYRSGDYDNAIAEYSRSLNLKGDYAEAFVSRGNAWRRKGETNRAIADYSRALGLKGDYAEVYNYRGYLYARQGNHARAAEDYTRALRLKSGYADAWFNRGYGYAELGDWDRAIADYTQVIKLEPSNAAAYRERAYAWSGKGDRARAAADYAAAEGLE
jgi:tetratricopeptide (TPR) repeat protein